MCNHSKEAFQGDKLQQNVAGGIYPRSKMARSLPSSSALSQDPNFGDFFFNSDAAEIFTTESLATRGNCWEGSQLKSQEKV